MLVLKEGNLYLQIYEYYKREIINGIYRANQKIPSKRELAKEYKISVNTVDNAYSKLLEEGFIYSRERSGFFVSDIGELYVLDSKPVIHREIKEDIDFDFSYTGVGSEKFPHNSLRKIANRVMFEKDILEPVEYQGYRPLREQISEYLSKSRGFKADYSQIIISSGSEYLFQILFKLIEGKYAIENPGYKMLKNIMKINGIKYNYIDVDDKGMNIEKLKKTDSDICVITPAHQFPTGVVMDMKRRIELLNLDRIKYVIEDDYDSEYRYVKRPIPALKSIDVNDKVIYIGSFSKSISPAFRVSFMVLPRELVDEYHKIYSSFVCPVSIIVQKILAKFIETGEFEKHLNRMRKIYHEKRKLIMEMLKDRKDINIKGDETGLHLLLEFPKKYSEEYILAECKKRKIKIHMLSSYGDTSKLEKKPTIVLGFATLSIDELKSGLNLLMEL